MDQQQQISLLTDDRADLIVGLSNQDHIDTIISYVQVEYKKKYITNNVSIVNEVGEQYNKNMLGKCGVYFIMVPEVSNSKSGVDVQRVTRIFYKLDEQQSIVQIEKYRNTRKTEQVQIPLATMGQTVEQYQPTPKQFEFIAAKLSQEEVSKRSKVAVKGGQMAFIGLSREKQYKLKGITKQEVSQHISEDDAWTVYNGKVYDITLYLDYHPGGKEKLMLGAGRDCTNLFNQFHPWVNGHAFLEKDQVGYLVASNKKK